MSSGQKRIKRGERISIEFLPAVYPEGKTAEELNEQVKQRIFEAKKAWHADADLQATLNSWICYPLKGY